MDYCLDRFYLLNFNNDEIWVGNTAAYLIISQMDGVKNLEEIINDLKKEFCDYTFEQIYGSMIKIIQELVENITKALFYLVHNIYFMPQY